MNDFTVRATRPAEATYSPSLSHGRQAGQIVAVVLVIGSLLWIVAVVIATLVLRRYPLQDHLSSLFVPFSVGMILFAISATRCRRASFPTGAPVVTLGVGGITVHGSEAKAPTHVAWSRRSVRILEKTPQGVQTPALCLRDERYGVWWIPLASLDADRSTLTSAIRELSGGRVDVR